MITIILTTITGVLTGTITGIVPGLHINLLSVIIASFAVEHFGNKILPAVFIFSTGITHNFIEAIPTTFFNTPTPETAMLPAQELVKDGKGIIAVKLFVLGAILGIITSIALMPLLNLAIPFLYAHTKKYTVLLLVLVMIMMILKEKGISKKIWAITIIILAGILGTKMLNSSIQQPLFLMFSGLFGTSALLLSTLNKTKICEQKTEDENFCSLGKATTAPIGAVASLMLTTLLPGIGASQASIIPSTIMKIKQNTHIILLGSIGTSDLIISLITFETINKARNGAIATITTLLNPDIWLLASIAMISAGIAAIATLFLAKKTTRILNKINYAKFCFSTMLFLFMMAFVFSGIYGIIAILTATAIGIIAQTKGISRSNAMSCIIIPIIINNMSKIAT